jgi:chromosome segregation ATPase
MITPRLLIDRLQARRQTADRPVQQRDVYAGIPDAGVDLEQAVRALAQNVEILIGVRGERGVALTIEDVDTLRGSLDRTFAKVDELPQSQRLDELRAALRSLEDLLTQQDVIMQQHIADRENPHEVKHDQLDDRNTPGAHQQIAITGLVDDLNDIRARLDNVEARLSGVESRLSSVESSVSSLNARVSALENA